MQNAFAGTSIFVDYYDHANWGFSDGGGDGQILDSGLAFVEILGDNSDNGQIDTSYTREMPCDGNVSFIWFYETSDPGLSGFDPAGYSIDGVFTPVTDDGVEEATQNGDESVPVLQGQVFGFVVRTDDGILGSAVFEVFPSEFPDDDCDVESEEPRTIGYWKNHQEETEEHLEMIIGEYVVETFDDATDVFNANAKNAHDMLAAQLLAAEINVWNNVPSCQEVDDAVEAAHGILTEAGWPMSMVPEKSAKGEVNAIKDILDEFNNYGCF
jgi:hypothetical protein